MPARNTPLKAIRTISAVSSAEAAPTSASAWVNLKDVGGGHHGKAKAMFTKPTLGNADNVVSITIWAQTGDGYIVPLATADMDTTDDQFVALDLGAVPDCSFWASVAAISGTTAAVTTTVYIFGYTDDQ